MRYFNFAPEILAQGHSVIFAVNFLDSDKEPARMYLNQLREEGVFTNYVEANLEVTRWRLKVGLRLLYPGLTKLVLRRDYQTFTDKIDHVADTTKADVIFISPLRLLFVQQASRARCAFVFDLCDCQTLFYFRQARLLLRTVKWRRLLTAAKSLLESITQEYYYGKNAIFKILASPVDKTYLDKITGRPETTVVIFNGVNSQSVSVYPPKSVSRVIFTGNMNFAPNYEAALWFATAVFPRVLLERPNATFVIAGANPVPEVLALASEHVIVTGYVADMHYEMASSYMFIAPLISGGGFKNKVLEAFISKTYVIATAIAVEFLDPHLRGLVCVANTPDEMVTAMIEAWENPDHVKARTEELYRIVSSDWGWRKRAEEVMDVAHRAAFSNRRAGGWISD